MPPKYLADLRGAEWDQLSFFQNISDVYGHINCYDMILCVDLALGLAPP